MQLNSPMHTNSGFVETETMVKHQRHEYEPIKRSSSYDDEIERGNEVLEHCDGGGGGVVSNDKDRRIAAISILLLMFLFLGILEIAQNNPPLAPPPPRVAVEGTAASNVSVSDIQEIGPPPLSDVIVGENIEGDVSWILNFAVVGFPKCGTSFLKNYLGRVPGVYMAESEWCSLSQDRPHELVELFYDNTDGADMEPDVKRGFKCPVSLQSEYALGNLATYFDRTDFIVQVRHPILWFQSFYNYRSYTKQPQQMLPSNELIGPCDASGPYVPLESGVVGKWRVCTDRANFHHALSRLGKTPMSSPKEMTLLQDHNMSVVPVRGKIFLMEVEQLADVNSTHVNHFRETLRGFLGIEGDMPTFRDHHMHTTNMDPENLAHTMNICDDEHAAVRSVLLASGRAASEWIREYFLKSPDVVVSSKEHFLDLLQSWEKDPCDEKAAV